MELYEGLLMLQHRGQDSAGMVTTDWERFAEHKDNGLVRDVFGTQSVMNQLKGVKSTVLVCIKGTCCKQVHYHRICLTE